MTFRLGINDTYWSHFTGGNQAKNLLHISTWFLTSNTPAYGYYHEAGVLMPDQTPSPSRLGTTWNSGTTYSIGEVAIYGDVCWTSIQNSNTNHAPAEGAWWRRSWYALAGSIGRDSDGYPSKFPDDTSLNIEIDLPFRFETYPITLDLVLPAGTRWHLKGHGSNVKGGYGNTDGVAYDEQAGQYQITYSAEQANAVIVLDGSRSTPSSAGSYTARRMPSGWEVASLVRTDDDSPGLASATYLDDTAPFASRRMMTSNGILSGYYTTMASLDPADRPTDASLVWNGAHGTPWEFDVDTCNRLDQDAFVNISFYASNDYITAQAQYYLANMNADRRVNVEWFNEIWNPVGAGSMADFLAAASSAGLGATEYGARRSRQAMQLWQAVWTGANRARLKCWGCGQAVNTGQLEVMLDFEDHHTYLDFCGVAPYWDNYGFGLYDTGNKNLTTANAALIPSNPTAFVTSALAATADAADAAVDGYVALKSWLASNYPALTLGTYEGPNQHVAVTNWGGDTAAALSAFDLFWRDSRLGDVYDAVHERIRNEAPSLLMSFDYCNKRTSSPFNFGMMDGGGFITQEPMASVRAYAAAYNESDEPAPVAPGRIAFLLRGR